MDYIEEFENDSFWEELIERIVARDLNRELGEKKYLAFDPMARVKKEEPYRIRYMEEFEVHGIDRLEIVSGSMVKPLAKRIQKIKISSTLLRNDS